MSDLADAFGTSFVALEQFDFPGTDRSGLSLGSKEHWDWQYKTSGTSTYEWFHDYQVYRGELLCAMAGLVNGTQDESDLSVPEGAQLPTNEMIELALKNISPDCTILNVGCGNSNLAMDLHLDGFQNILSVDYSSVVIDSLNQQYPGHPSLKFQCVDCRNMPELATNSIDFALDKGTLDAVRILGAQNAEAMLSEICRVLSPGGMYLIMSCGSPWQRMPQLRDIPGWTCSHRVLADGLHMYICVKQ